MNPVEDYIDKFDRLSAEYREQLRKEIAERLPNIIGKDMASVAEISSIVNHDTFSITFPGYHPIEVDIDHVLDGPDRITFKYNSGPSLYYALDYVIYSSNLAEVLKAAKKTDVWSKIKKFFKSKKRDVRD